MSLTTSQVEGAVRMAEAASQQTGFTSFQIQDEDGNPSTFTNLLQPPVGYELVPYEDQGYHGGLYWAILPIGTTRQGAFGIFESEGHINTLVDVGQHLVES